MAWKGMLYSVNKHLSTVIPLHSKLHTRYASVRGAFHADDSLQGQIQTTGAHVHLAFAIAIS